MNEYQFENEDVSYLYDIVDHSTPIYKFSNENESIQDLQVLREWYYTVVEGKDFTVDMKESFNCWIDKLQVKNNIELLKKYKDVLYTTLETHRKLDNEVQVLMKKSYENIETINELTL